MSGLDGSQVCERLSRLVETNFAAAGTMFNLVWQSFGTKDLQQGHIRQFRTLRGYCPQSILTCTPDAGQDARLRPKCHQGTTYYESCHHPFQGPDRSEL